MKRRRNYEKGSPFERTISKREHTGDGAAQPTSCPNEPVDAGMPPLILMARQRLSTWRVRTNCQNGKRKHAPIRRGAVKLRNAAEARRALKFEKNVKFGRVMTLMTAAGTVIANENLMPARKNGGNVTGRALKRMLRRSCSRECGTSQPVNRADWYAPCSWCEH